MLFPRSVAVSYYLAVEYQQQLAAQTLREVRYRRSDKLFLFLFGGNEDRWLEYSFSPPRFLLQRGKPELADSFGIWPEVADNRVHRVVGRPDNRLIEFEIVGETVGGQLEERRIRFELFGALCNAFLLDAEGEIEHATRIVNDDRALRPGLIYTEPKTLKPLRALGEAVVFESDAAVYKLRFQRHIHQVVAEVRPGKLAFKPDHRQPLTSLFQGLAAGELSERTVDRSRQKLAQWLKKEITRLTAKLDQLKQRLDRCGEAERYRQRGDLLMANPHVEPHDGQVRVQDLYNEGEVDIPLEPGKSLIETATAYYKQAKKLSRAPEHLKQRIAANSKRLAELQAASAQLSELAEPEKVKELAARLGAGGRGQRRGGGKDSDEALPYRSFTAPAGEKILVGKSAADNDTLTFRIARSYDYWFHVQQSRGSHVILVVQDKNQKPSRRAIETAASLAAYYSDERNGDHVPVIYTHRRHVRKARKGAPGLVIPERVESIFVVPQLPQSGDRNLD